MRRVDLTVYMTIDVPDGISTENDGDNDEMVEYVIKHFNEASLMWLEDCYCREDGNQ